MFKLVDGVSVPLTKEELEARAARAAEAAAQFAANEYKYKRQADYPSIEDQLDDLYHNGYDGWRATIQEIKERHPKPE